MESSEAGLFTSNNASRAGARCLHNCAILCAETSKKEEELAHMEVDGLEDVDSVACPLCRENWRYASYCYCYYDS